MLKHRELYLKQLVALALAAVIGSAQSAFAQALQPEPLDPTIVPKFVTPLVIPPAMPRATKLPAGVSPKKTDYYEIALRQFQQQILPATDANGLPTNLGRTTVWGYGSTENPATFHSPSFTIEAKYNKPVQVRWVNQLVDDNGNYLRHLLPVDQTIHWANPAGGLNGRDMETLSRDRYEGPVPMVVHLHGAHAAQESDGFPQAWYLPAAQGITACVKPEDTGCYATTGSAYDVFKANLLVKNPVLASLWGPGAAAFEYDNVQPASTLWFHDHTMGITRLNVYAGPAGFYLLRGGPSDMVGGTLPGPAPAIGDLPGKKYYEIPIVIQDRSFNPDGSLWYPDNRTFFDGGFVVPYIPETVPGGNRPVSDVSPIWNPEVFGNTMVVNGRTWPYLNVEARRYRFRFLNGSNARFLILKMSNDKTSNDLPFWQIGADGGFLPAPVSLTQLLLGPAERADVIVDFTNVPVGTTLTLQNLGPDEPFGSVLPDNPEYVNIMANPETTGRVMQLRVVKRSGSDSSTPPDKLVLPAPTRISGPVAMTRQLSLNEYDSEKVCLTADPEDPATGTPTPIACSDPAGIYPFGPQMARLGTMEGTTPVGLFFQDTITETPNVGEVEVWAINNFTADAHPIHIHQVQFEVLDRVALDAYDPQLPEPQGRGPEAWESGLKDTVVAYPGEVTLVKAKFDRAGTFVWHCHILEHEDNDMMRPICVGGDCMWPMMNH